MSSAAAVPQRPRADDAGHEAPPHFLRGILRAAAALLAALALACLAALAVGRALSPARGVLAYLLTARCGRPTGTVYFTDAARALHVSRGLRVPDLLLVWQPDGALLTLATQSYTALLLPPAARDAGEAAALYTDPTVMRTFTLSPDQRTLAFLTIRPGGGWEVRAVDLTTRGERTLHTGFSWYDNLTWSPDGTRVAFVGNPADVPSGIYVLTVADGAAQRLTDVPGISAPLAWSPDGARLAFGLGTGGIAQVDATSGARRTLLDTPWVVDALAWSAHGLALAMVDGAQGSRHIFLLDPEGSVLSPVTGGATCASYPGWVPP